MEIGGIQRAPKEIVEGFKQVPTSTVSDALDIMGINGIVNGFRALVAGVIIAGTAFTLKEVTGVKGTYSLEDFAVSEIVDTVEEGDVLVCDNGGQQVSTMGGLGALAMKLRGVVGMVVDGGVRDVQEIIGVPFPAYVRHTCATSGKTRIKYIARNVPVQIGNIRVNPGDIIVADDTAIAVVPANKGEEVLHQCQRIEEKERQVRNELKKGKTFDEAVRQIKAYV